jgi:hypothetical protein
MAVKLSNGKIVIVGVAGGIKDWASPNYNFSSHVYVVNSNLEVELEKPIFYTDTTYKNRHHITRLMLYKDTVFLSLILPFPSWADRTPAGIFRPYYLRV